MRMQVLVATMNQSNYQLLDKMNIQTDAIVCNQCDRNEFSAFSYKENLIKWFSFKETGVGLNRNNALMRADADIIMIADDDLEYVDGYEKIVLDAFRELPEADVIIFDLKYPYDDRPPITEIKRLNKKGCMRFGGARIAARLTSIHFNGLCFNLCFGGGAIYSSGEDTIFLNDCLNKNLSVYAYPKVIAALKDERASTWFTGYTSKFFFDKGIVYFLLNPYLCDLFAAYHCLKHRNRYQQYGWKSALKQMRKGIKYARKKEYKN